MQWNRKNSGFGLRSSSLATYLLYEICLLSLFSEPLLSSVMTIVSNRKFIHAGPIRQFSRSTNVGKVVYKWKNAIQNSMTARYKTAEKSVVKIHSEILKLRVHNIFISVVLLAQPEKTNQINHQCQLVNWRHKWDVCIQFSEWPFKLPFYTLSNFVFFKVWSSHSQHYIWLVCC